MLADRDLYQVFEKLFKEHYEALSNYAFSILRNKDDAEDIVQDVFIKLWQNSPDVIHTPQVKFYLLTAVKNGCISFLRKQAGKKFVQPDNLQLTTSEDSRDHTTDPAKLVGDAISLLPTQCAVIFKMSRFGKLTYGQIAQELGISVKTVENQVGKALRIMREYARKNNLSFACLFILLLSFASCVCSIKYLEGVGVSAIAAF
jgi:RNA polymerase sigma-70 factor (family 1)